MPSQQLKTWAKEANMPIEEAEEKWEECKKQAKKKIKKEDSHFWSYVNICTRGKLGLLKEAKEDLNLFYECDCQDSKLNKW